MYRGKDLSGLLPYTDRGQSRLYVALLSLRPYGPRSRAHITPFYARSYKTVPSTDTSSKPTFTTIYPQSSDIQYESTVIVHRVIEANSVRIRERGLFGNQSRYFGCGARPTRRVHTCCPPSAGSTAARPLGSRSRFTVALSYHVQILPGSLPMPLACSQTNPSDGRKS